MIPGGFSPSDRPLLEHELHTDTPNTNRRTSRSSAKAAWIKLVVIVMLIAATIVLLSYMPDA